MRILIAGIGNIFRGDDGFGCNVLREMHRLGLPPGIDIIDFSIRGYDLAYTLTDGYDMTIMVNALSRGNKPGTIYLVEPLLNELSPITPEGHSLNPVSIIQIAQAMGTISGKLLLVGCEPGALENEKGEFTLSPAVRAAVSEAAELIRYLVKETLAENRPKDEVTVK